MFAMTEPEQPSPYVQFSLRSCLILIIVVSWALAVDTWQGSVYGWRTAVPAGVVAMFALLFDRAALIGAALGFGVFALVYFLLTGGKQGIDPVKATILCGAYGAAIGSSVQAIIFRPRIVGVVSLVGSAILFVILLIMN